MTDDLVAHGLPDGAIDVLTDAMWGREGSREALQRLKSDCPELGAILAQKCGDAANRAETALVRQASRGNVLDEESTRDWLAGVRVTLTQPGDTELEAMLVHRVALCWLALNDAEAERATKRADGIGYASGDFLDKHLARLNADLFKAMKALATVRKLRRPVVQVNIADKQVNVAG